MSGVETAGLVFGVLPVIFEALKAYRSTYDKIRIFHHCSEELTSIQNRLISQKCIFSHNCRLLLRLVAEDERINEMLAESSSGTSTWRDKRLNDQMNEALDSNFDHCKTIIEDTKAVLDEFEEGLKDFDVVTSERVKGESLRKTFLRVRKAAAMSFEKSRFEKNLADLKERNYDLKELRCQINELQQLPQTSSTLSYPRKCPHTRYNLIQKTSQKLHEALTDAWKCQDAAHFGHYAKLCVDAEVGSGVQLKMAVSYQRRVAQNATRSAIEEPPIWLCVQSTTIDTSPSDNICGKRKVRWADDVETSQITRPHRVHMADNSGGTATALQTTPLVMTITPSISIQTTSSSYTALSTLPTVIVNLCKTNICSHLKQCCSAQAVQSQCLGYLENSQGPDLFKHMLYSESVPKRPSIQRTITTGDLVSIEEALNMFDKEELDPVDQLTLAIKLTRTVLQFHSTAWLKECWSLADLALFGDRSQLSEDTLRKLHLTSQMPDSASIEPCDTAMEGVEAMQTPVALTPEQAELNHGIRNLAIFNLGKALLQIGCWRPLHILHQMKLRQQHDPHYIKTARFVASGRLLPGLGPKYRDIVQKCLYNDFGFGHDLNKEELQTAINNQVISELESMIKDWSISSGS
ncbi:hypothetical protein K469DRAFT_606524 [Zopfia rhizophila CBS 207.26]|uniref:DUF7580 domain-containing protein n=1 Tax=Zopfia rhizophila CBS 207.26 TaxID=1314779 RepID=A0A6A6DF76_9PEZI|nr:hypothetical protein K469DRAFT_606524 [Zopfia rhizophila CBS 207.26]